MNRRLLIISAVVVAALALLAIYLSRQRLRRARAYRGAAAVERAIKPSRVQPIPPVEEWTEQFTTLQAAGEWEELDELLDAIETRSPGFYGKWSLGYLHARTLIEDDEPGEASRRLMPFLRAGSPFRDLALFHQAEIEETGGAADAASRTRQTLIREAPKSQYRSEAIDAELEYLSDKGDADALIRFASALSPAEPTARRRDLESRVAEALVGGNARRTAYEKALTIIRGGITDDAADRAARVLDRAEFLPMLDGPQLAALGEALRNHRHFDRAVEVLRLALPRMAAGSPERDEVLFAIGRSHFGAERYPAAMQTYLSGANSTRDPRQKATYLLHASRAAQLSGEDASAERLMTAAIAVPGRFPATTAALTQRIRTRLQKNRRAEAAADLELLRKIAPKDHALVEGALAFAVSGKEIAVSALGSVPPALLDKHDQTEFAYWRGCAAEGRDPSASFREYLQVLRATVPSHFAYLARDRLRTAPLNQRRREEIALRDRQIAQLLSQRQFAAAKDVATDRYLLSSEDLAAATGQLARIYREIPEYEAILDLEPKALPSFPAVDSDRASLLMAMGLFDEAIDEIKQRYPLRPMASALTQAVALNRAGAARESIYAVEVLMRSVPADFAPDLLPRTIRELLYPRYFHQAILDDAKKFGTDPTLLLAIMREESRFDPRAKSEAAARGLLQFIITTAVQIGREVGLVELTPEDLYDPRVIIRLGAKYVANLAQRFAGDPYKVTAAYNAGPNQSALWARLAGDAGADRFVSAINFDETKHYVRKVMNSYRRYAEIYGASGPQGGLRAEP